jgi:hypothetical protein
LARLIRLAVVASGTMNAWAISAVLRPPTAHRVSGIASVGVSAGWQDMNSNASESSRSDTAAATVGSLAATVSSRRRLASSLRQISASRRDATVISQPRGLVGVPLIGQWVAAASRASYTASSASVKSPWPRTSTPMDLRRQFTHQVLDTRASGYHSGAGRS